MMKEAISRNKLEKSYFDVLGLCCSTEVTIIEKILKPLEGVDHVSVIVPSRTVIVLHDVTIISQSQIVKALNQARLEANVRMKGDQSYRNKWPSPLASVCGVLLLLSFIQYAFSPFKWLALGAVAVGVLPLILKAIQSMRNLRIDINVLMLIAVGGSISLKDYWEAATIVFLLNISEWLETRASHKATAVMSSLMNIAPQTAILADTGEEVNANDVKVNTRLAVKAGTMIPIDGVVVEGNCEVDEKALTGESFPVSKQVDSIVYAGTVNLNGYISVITTALAEACVVARMAKLVEEAQNSKSKTQRYVDKIAKYYTPAVCVVAACLAAIPAALRVHNVDKWYHLALVVLVSACPCALILSTPIAAFCAFSKAATSGLLFKGAEYLEILSTVKFICFDKTGTITKGEFSVSNFDPLIEDDKLLYWVSSIESKSSHPMAAALVDYAKSHSFEPQSDNVEEFKDFPGEGIYGKIDGKDVYIGNQKIAVRAGCSQVLRYGTENGDGKSLGYIFLGSALAGTFSLSDSCRIGVKEALEELKSMGIKTAMLTGDCQAAANHAQNQLGGALDVVHAELLPQDKAKIIKEIQKESKTAMVGDGLNDAPALATADIGISMGVSGSALANETGHVILMSNDIRKIPVAVRLARKTRRKIFENIFIAGITKAAVIALAIAGHPLVWAAVLADVGTCLLVIFNSMLLLQGVSSKTTHHQRSSSSQNDAHCSSDSKVHNKCSDGCCGQDDNSQQLKHLVKETNENYTCCGPIEDDCCVVDDHDYELKQATDKCCGQVKQVQNKCSDVGEKLGGCCGQDDNSQQLKHLVKETNENYYTCCGPIEDDCCVVDDNDYEVNQATDKCCGQVKQVQNKFSDVGEKLGGCCGQDDNSQQLKHLVKETNENYYTCCGPVEDDCCVVDNHDHEVKQATDKCCGHDAHEVKQVVQQPEPEPEQEKEKHGCCSHEDDDEIREIKQVVQPHVTKDLELQKRSQCCLNEVTQKKSHCNTSLKTKDDGDDQVKEYITSEQLGKAVSSCCKNRGLKKRHISGCCKSLVYKCGAGFNKKVYLSEIVIE